ncbi:unnamed protein product [Fusarium graminearum]|uniref:Chromosome 2, complete genome n=1 Tax=Gibberella zeae (strain ATCC MYA-4620 / CBS 123657 / FGSC 9075 / NRRL 31084 / PH-1) TaxID=229533 RepID=I1S8T8_GIBZE|nr:hypothetical protein FGSG_13266 [Fusarium graminearum PH-1]ESU14349.1 hypothetical protein FGSG_13266 [Fusarium graminearum PH-1]EYB28706.1 hypothetical protein FG05_13266 [Fusarium graminearum]CEF77401.1 unnamed protein product [Fusarium graminearum]CZS80693.1 unnamed protein product [Fusarium graminearum]|eukprot:XP_011319774.1 hypothetical protein FGSG_13266 [Fusarium graminearum PH-1]
MSKSQDLIRPFWSPNNVVKLSMTCLTGIGYDVLGEIETTSSYQCPPPSSYLCLNVPTPAGFGRRLPDWTHRRAPYRLIVCPSTAVRYHRPCNSRFLVQGQGAGTDYRAKTPLPSKF